MQKFSHLLHHDSEELSSEEFVEQNCFHKAWQNFFFRPLQQYLGFLWYPIPEVADTQQLRTEVCLFVWISMLISGSCIAAFAEIWLTVQIALSKFIGEAKYPVVQTGTSPCFIGVESVAEDTILYATAVIGIFAFGFLLTGPYQAYKKVILRFENNGVKPNWTIAGTWSSLFLTIAAIYIVIRGLNSESFSFSPKTLEISKIVIPATGLFVLVTQLLECFALEYFVHLDAEGELMTSPIKVDNDSMQDFPEVPISLNSQSSTQTAGHGEPQWNTLIHPKTLEWYQDNIALLRGRTPMLLLCKPVAGEVYQVVLQPLGARSLNIGATSFRYDQNANHGVIKLNVGKIIYVIELKQSAIDAIEYALTRLDYVWCDAISVSFLRQLDKKMGDEAFNKMAQVYKFYTCVPSFNWTEDPGYCIRGWMWQEYICGKLLVHDRKDTATLQKILHSRGEQDPGTKKVLKRKKMTTHLIAHLLDSAIKHYEVCEITEPDDLPNACFGLLRSLGLFRQLPSNGSSLADYADWSRPAA
jgi:hypothetical protein